MSLSPAATIVLSRAAERPDHRLEFHRKLPTGGRHKMIDALLRDGLIAETQGEYRIGDGSTVIEDASTGLMLTTLILTDTGFRALGRESAAAAMPTETHTAPYAPPRSSALHAGGNDANAACEPPVAATGLVARKPSLREAATALLAAWDASADLAPCIDAIRSSITKPPRASTLHVRRTDTKRAAVLALLRRPEGATIAQIVTATAWAQHTVRGFLANLKRKGVAVEVLDRVRQAGPGSTGAKGSYSIYRISEAG